MEFHVREIGADVASVEGQGRLNSVSAPALRASVDRAIDGERPRIVVDLSRVEFMDSSGLGALIASLKAARSAGGDLRIAAPSKQVSMVLQLSNLDRVLKPYESVEEAYVD